MTYFSAETTHILAANGWQEDRHIDTSEYERALRAAGYDDCQAACEFLQHYGDLELQVDPEIEENCLNTLMSEIMKTVPVSYFSQEAGRTLYDIGKCCYDFMPLLMDSSGRVYRHLGMSSQNVGGLHLYLIAGSGEEAIEMLVQEDQAEADAEGKWLTSGKWIAHKDC